MWLFCAQAAGILTAEYSGVGLWPVWAAAAVASRAFSRSWTLPVLALAAGATCFVHAGQRARAALPLVAGDIVVDGRVHARERAVSGLRFTLDLADPHRPRRVALWVPARQLRGAGAADEVPAIARAVPGESWRLALRLRAPRVTHNPGAFDPTPGLARRGIAARASMSDPNLGVRTGRTTSSAAHQGLRALRDALRRPLLGPDVGKALIAALVLGERDGLDSATHAFVRLGAVHLLAISGLHVGLVMSGGYWLASVALRRLLPMRRGGDPRSCALGCALALAFGYALIAGFGLPLRRALVFASVAALGFGVRRPGGARAGFFAAGSLLLAWEPATLFDPGAQLSFAAVGGLLFARPAPGEAGLGWLHRAVRGSATALVATTPVLAAHGFATTPVGLLSNVILVPWVGLVVLPLGLTSVIVSALGLGDGPLGVAIAISGGTVDGLQWAASALPPASRVPAGPGLGLAAVGGVCALGLALERTSVRAACALLAGLALAVWPAGGRSLPDHFAVFLDVGSGDAVIVRSEERAVLVDAGLGWEGGPDLGRSRVLPALAALGIGALDLVIATHADADHAGGLVSVVRGLPVQELWIPEGGREEAAWGRLLAAAEAAGVSVREVSRGGPARSLGGELRVETLWPPRAFRAKDRNAGSIVVRVWVDGVRLLLTGDLGAEGERALMRSGLDLRADVLKLGHHGSATSTLPSWLDRVAPAAAVVSAACDRPGLPAPEVLQRVSDRGVPLWWTGRDGAVVVSTGPLAVRGYAPARGCGPVGQRLRVRASRAAGTPGR